MVFYLKVSSSLNLQSKPENDCAGGLDGSPKMGILQLDD
jgi:hypothetical protein